jgi:hypothetical protein
MPGDYPYKPYLSDPSWTWISTGGNYTYTYPYVFTPTKAEFDELKADAAEIKATLERQFGTPGPLSDPLRADDV